MRINFEEFRILMDRNFKDPDLDSEQKHINADLLMCEVLSSLGYKEGVEVFKEAEKWYS